ncbi:hypothetical protein ASD79_02525 [Caulobacter sp. Root655]|uniref:DUF2339 domain-containing protein n=1 Tax=Caulobacter sp. Root655 TaxID=1736578 RepID=UPI0006FABA16|nr:DUF2339 domain-containing protein [Caulobacter sp. Root655]KRA66176.1 hypothetical protein ASD79_02525 [Caulobacter sp. Root655]
MTWLCIIALAVWIFLQDRRLKALEARLRDLSGAPPVVRAPGPAAAVEPKQSPVKPTVPAHAPALVAETAPAASVSRPPVAPQAPPAPPRPPSPSAPPLTWAATSTWMAENGLAWLGGGGLALGGLLLVVLAAQRGVFTPPFRIVAAAILGLAMVAASEWIRRQNNAPGGRHALAAAVAAGAGAVTLYGAVWAAHVLYGLISLPVAAALAVTVSAGLLGLALLHGEALALLALFGAFLAPALSRHGVWPPLVEEGYVALLAVTGSAIVALRRWARAGVVTLAGLAVWILMALIAVRGPSVSVLLVLALAGPVAAVLWRRRVDDAPPARDLLTRLPTIALVTVSVGAFGLWLAESGEGNQPVTAALLGGLLIVAGAAMTVPRLAPPLAFAAPVVVATLGLLFILTSRRFVEDSPLILGLQVLGLAGVMAGAALAGALRGPPGNRTPLLAIGAVGAAALATLAWPVLDHLPGERGGLIAGLTAVLLAAGAVLIARRVEDPRRDPGLGLWIAAAAELAFLTVHATVADHLEPAAMALAALALAAIANRLAWRGLAATSTAGAVAALAVMLRPGFVADASSGQLALPLLALVTALAAGALLAAARIVGGKLAEHRTEAEALSTGALLVLLTGLFLMLHAGLATGHPADHGQALLEASLRTALILAAGLLLAVRGRPDDGPIARWRLIVVASLGALHGLATGGLVLNPWWGAGHPVGGPPLLNDLLLTFLAPALLLGAIAHRRPDARDRWTRGWTVAAAVFALLWAVTATRHAFHGAAMDVAAIGRAEACAYAVIGLLTARAFRMRRLDATRAAWLYAAAPAVGWTALAAALLVFGWLASPWWGPSEAPMASSWHVALVLALYAAGAGAAASLRRGGLAFARVALCVAVGVLFAFVTLLVRWVFHGADMRDGLDRGGLETWTFSAVWAAFGLVVLFRASAREDVALRWLGLVVLLVTAAKVLLFDMATLDGVVRAASFLAVGALFIAGALVVRRLNAAPKTSPDADRITAP